MKPILGLVTLDLKMFFRNRQLVFFNFIAPVMLIVIFGLAFARPTFKSSVGLSASTPGALAAAVRAGLESSPMVEVREYAPEELWAAVAERKVDLGVLVPGAEGAAETRALRVLHTDPLAPMGQLALSVLGDVLHRAGHDVAGADPPLTYAATVVASLQREVTYVDFVTPGILSMSIFAFCLFSIVYVIAMRENGTLKRLQATPFRRGSFLTAQVLLRFVLMALQVAALLSLAVLLFGFRVHGSGWALAALLAVAGPSFICLSFALGGFCRKNRVANGLINLAYTPQVFLGGVFFPLHALPVPAQLVVGGLPLSCLVSGARAVSLEGATLGDIQGQLAALAAWGIGSFLLARRTFRWS